MSSKLDIKFNEMSKSIEALLAKKKKVIKVPIVLTSIEKREKKFMKLQEYYTNPYFNAVKELYVKDNIKSLPTAINLLKKIKLTKKNIINKNSITALK